MEVSVVGCSQTSVGNLELSTRRTGFCNLQQICPKPSRIGFNGKGKWGKGSLQLTSKAIGAQVSEQHQSVVVEETVANGSIRKPEDEVRLFVGLPLESVSNCNELNHAKAIAVSLRALKLLGVDGVELPVWWGIVEKEAQGEYDWSAYLELAGMVQDAGLKLRVSLCFHAASDHAIPLPKWVSKIGDVHPDIYFTDRNARRYKDCLSLAVDELPVFDGRTPMEVYSNFMESFRCSFSDFIGSTITDISVGLGPNGELRYPSFGLPVNHRFSGVGEFQCYDKHMLDQLKQHAEANGNHLWGLSGPHDAPAYNQPPDSNIFFRDNGGSWETPYGDFFLSWYSNQLISHGNRLLSLASTAFGDFPVTVSGKIPLMHMWYKTRSRASELTAGFYNPDKRDGYAAVAEMFARHSCVLVVPGMDLSDQNQPQGSKSSPDALLSQIMEACKKHGGVVCGENLSGSQVASGFSNIRERLLSPPVRSFTYQRIGAYFFSPEHFPKFTEFVRSLDQEELDVDDMPSKAEGVISLPTCSEPQVHMQAA